MSRLLGFHPRWLIFCLIVAVASSAIGRDGFSHAIAVDNAVRAEMERQKIVGAAVGVIRDAKVVYTHGYGFANLKSRTPVTDTTVFNWASNSKPVMALLAMLLVQEIRLDLDKPISAYLSNLPAHLQKITARQLLCHQSGIPHYANGVVVPSPKTIAAKEQIDPAKSMHRFLMSPLIFTPGSKTDYSSYAYVLLSAVVQGAGTQPIDQMLRQRLSTPLAMNSFQLDLPFDRQRNWVKAYRNVDGRPVEVPDYAHYWKHGAGGYKSNVKDFARFALALAKSELITRRTTALMWTPQKTSDGRVSSYGLGVVVSGSGNALKISHNGSQDETRTRMVLYPRQRHGIVVMCNTQGSEPGRISTAIYSALNRR